MQLNDVLMFFDGHPTELQLYLALQDCILQELGEGVNIAVKRTQINFANRRNFAFASMPLRRRKGWPKECLLVSFGLAYRVDSPRIAEAVEPYPNRWTHHLLLERADQIDAELMAWIREAAEFSAAKR